MNTDKDTDRLNFAIKKRWLRRSRQEGIMRKNKELAKLMGWTNHGHGYWNNPRGRMSSLPVYDTDLNAMSDVWVALDEQGLFDDFWRTYWGIGIHAGTQETLSAAIYIFLTDPIGQLEAATAVLRQANTSLKTA